MENLKQIRKLLKINQSEVAQAAKICHSDYVNFENGKLFFGQRKARIVEKRIKAFLWPKFTIFVKKQEEEFNKLIDLHESLM